MCADILMYVLCATALQRRIHHLNNVLLLNGISPLYAVTVTICGSDHLSIKN